MTMISKYAGIFLWVLAIWTAFASYKTGKRWNYGVSSDFIQAVQSPSTGDIYTVETLGNGDTVVSKISGATGLPIWSTRAILKPSFKSLALNHDESKLYAYHLIHRYFAKDHPKPSSSKSTTCPNYWFLIFACEISKYRLFKWCFGDIWWVWG